MVTPNRRRQAVGELEDVFGVSQRRACNVVGQPRSTQRLAAPVAVAMRSNRSVSGCERSRNAGLVGVGVVRRKAFDVRAGQ